VTSTDFSPRVFPDVQGGPLRSPPNWINVLDFESLQAAVDAAPPGSVVYIPAGGYNAVTRPSYYPPLSLPHDRAMTILGDGPRHTVLGHRRQDHPDLFDPDRDLLQIHGDYQTVRGLSLVGGSNGVFQGPGVGIRIWRAQDPGAPPTPIIYRAQVIDCEIGGSLAWGIRVDDTPRNGVPQFAVWCFYDNIEITGVEEGCVYLGTGGTTTQYFKNCNFKNYSGYGVYSNHSWGLSLIDCIVENGAFQPYVYLLDSSSVSIQHCWFEGTGIPERPFIAADGIYHGLVIDRCLFTQNAGPQQSNIAAIRIGGHGRAVAIRNAFLNCPGDATQGQGGHIVIDPPADPARPSEVLIEGCTLADGTGLFQDPLHGHPYITNGSAMTVMAGTNWRARLPRLTAGQLAGLQGVEAGDMIFNATAGKAQVHDGTVWRDLW
jgi:hypothetical protein